MRSLLRPPAGDLATGLLEQLGARRLEPYRDLRGHDFFPSRRELDQVPNPVAAYRRRPARRVLYLHYFTSSADHYVAGFAPDTGLAYGYTDEPDLGLHDWGWFDLNAMCGLLYKGFSQRLIRRDLDWRPRVARDVISHDRLAG